ncbi:hypothetical protein WN943_024378 [Citrus x changshan-huyou]
MLFPWATDAAAKFGIPRLVFHGTSFLSLCATACLMLYEPHKKVSSVSEPFVIPNLPGDIRLTRNQLPDTMKQDDETDFSRLFKAAVESELKSYGVVVNSFYELEPAYAVHYRKLKSKQPNSVVYLCFGSLANFTSAQLTEIAMGLQASEQNFIWIVRKNKNSGGEEEKEDWLPLGFEKRMEGKGLIIRGWAPQVLILDHEAVGGFVTHCGWNSTLEGVVAVAPLVTWPHFADQFYNEKLVTQVLKIGVAVGVGKSSTTERGFVRRERIEKAVKEIMVGDKAEQMRSRAKAFGEMAQRAVENGGSSFSNLNSLIEELSLRSHLL